MAMTLYATNVYSNDGKKLLWSGALENSITVAVTSSGLSFYASDRFSGEWAYMGGGTFLGVAASKDSSTPTYPVGTQFTTAQSTLNLYAVTEGDGESYTLKINYGDTSLFSSPITGAVTKTLSCSGKVMEGDVQVIVE